MKPRCTTHRTRALTLMDVMIILCMICFLGMMLIPELRLAKKKTKKISCTSNLKQTGLAIKIWAGDHYGNYPTQTSVTNGGTLELMNSSDAWRAFQVMSNRLSSSYIMYCPADKTRTRITNFDDSLKRHISYFISLDATDADPQSAVFGDSNLEFPQTNMPVGLFTLDAYAPPHWSFARHAGSGNVALADGSVQSITSSGWSNLCINTTLATNRIFIP